MYIFNYIWKFKLKKPKLTIIYKLNKLQLQVYAEKCYKKKFFIFIFSLKQGIKIKLFKKAKKHKKIF